MTKGTKVIQFTPSMGTYGRTHGRICGRKTNTNAVDLANVRKALRLELAYLRRLSMIIFFAGFLCFTLLVMVVVSMTIQHGVLPFAVVFAALFIMGAATILAIATFWIEEAIREKVNQLNKETF